MLEKIIAPLTILFVFVIVSLSALSLFIDVPSPLNRSVGYNRTKLVDISELGSENLVGISELSVSGGGKVNLKKDPQPFVDIQEDNDKLGFYVDNEKLYIGLQNHLWFGNFSNNSYVVNLGLSEVNDLSVSGSGEINIDGLATTDLGTKISGSGDMNITNLQATTIDSKISGSGKLNIDGKVDSIEAKISGSGEFNGQNLESSSAEAKISGSGEVRVFANETLDVDISGSGRVEYKGKPVIDQDISGSGSVRRLKTDAE